MSRGKRLLEQVPTWECCSTEAQTDCCEPSSKEACCAESAKGGTCGCRAGASSTDTDEIREAVRPAMPPRHA